MARKIANGVAVSEIAKDAGVSNSTVSRFLNHPEKVTEATTKLIQASMDRLGYDISKANRTKNTIRPAIIVFACNSISDNDKFVSTIIEGVTSFCTQMKYNLLIKIITPDEKGYEDLCRTIQIINTQGLITMAQLSHRQLTSIAEQIPIVQCCEYNGNEISSSVSIDLNNATRKLMYHILTSGRRKIGFMSMKDNPMFIAQQRRYAYRNVIETENLEYNPDWEILLGQTDFSIAMSSALRVLSSVNRPDAFIASSDYYAAAIIKAAYMAGLKVPEDVVVCGFDNLEISEAMTPTITTINIPAYQMGYISCEQLIHTIESKNTKKQNIYLDTNLIIRGSSTSLETYS